MRIEPMTCAIGAELTGVNLAHAIHNDDLFGEIRQALFTHKVLFLRNQDFSRAEHVAFARRFGELEDHPVVGSDPEHAGLVQIYKTPDQAPDRYENAWHSDATWREAPQFGAVLRCIKADVHKSNSLRSSSPRSVPAQGLQARNFLRFSPQVLDLTGDSQEIQNSCG